MSNLASNKNLTEINGPVSADELLRLYRQRSGLTQHQLAVQLGFETTRMVKKWEGRFSLPAPAALKKIIEFYLSQGVFVKGQEHQEAWQLWHTVKNSYETGQVKARVYPPFDRAWFDSLLIPAAATTLTASLDLTGDWLNQPALALDHNLPASMTSFIGREKELKEINRLLATTHLLTLTGTGGIGKTRLALQSAQQNLKEFKDGIWFIELAAITTPEQTVQEVGRVLQVTEKARQPLLTSLKDYLRDKELLLILDNCEHLAQDCAVLATELLSYCPSLKILATSRERLRVAGEINWRVPALSFSLPEMELLNLENVQNDEVSNGPLLPDAVELLVERVQAVQSGFSLNNHNRQAVFELCRQLEGLPLAIELAAVRARVLSIEQINARLSERFQLLTGGSAAALPRQQTLQALIDWSYDLINKKEQTLFVRLSVFVEGFSLEAVEAVCAGDGILPPEVPGLLLELVTRSLVTARHFGQVMLYNQLETLRQYGRSRLETSGTEQRWRENHYNYYLGFLIEHQPGFNSGNQKETTELVEREYLNCRKALTWVLDRQAKSSALTLCEHLFPFWELRSYLSEGKSLVERSLKLPGPVEKAQQSKALIYLARFCELQGDYETGLTYALECREISRETGDTSVITANLTLLANLNMWLGNNKVAWDFHNQNLDLQHKLNSELGLAALLANMGRLAMFESNYQIATKFSLESLELYRKIGQDQGLTKTLNTLGIINQHQGNYEAARSYYAESASLAKALGIREMVASTLTNLGTLATQQGNYETAKANYLESLLLHKAVGNRSFAANVLANLGEISGIQGDYISAQNYTLEALAIKREIGDKFVQAICLNNLGNFTTNQGDYEAALLYCQESLTIRRGLENKLGIASCYTNLGNLASLQADYNTAHEYYWQSLQLQRQIGDTYAIVTGLINLGLLAVRQGQSRQAEEYLLESVQLGHELQNQLGLANILTVTVILWSEQPGRAVQAAHLVNLVETLLTSSGGVLAQVYLQPYEEAKLKLEAQLDLAGLASEKTNAPELAEEVLEALSLIASEMQTVKQA